MNLVHKRPHDTGMYSSGFIDLFRICVLLLGVLVLADLSSAYPGNSSYTQHSRSKRQIYNCRNKPEAVTFRCSPDACIDIDRVCDGAPDCPNSADETRDQCGSNAQCPGLSFRCDYGACVDSDSRCNGVAECADGSDERNSLCRRGSQNQAGSRPSKPKPKPGLGLSNEPNTNGCPGKNDYRCADGVCVDGTLVCDGGKDCADGSDETYTLCYNLGCVSYSFRCAYGGCIDRGKRCDGVKNCADGSDEDDSLCRGMAGQHQETTPSSRPSATQGTPRPPPRPTQRPTPRPTASSRPNPTPRPLAPVTQPPAPAPPSSGNSQSQCYLPEQHSGGRYTVRGCSPGDGGSLCRATPGTPAPESTALLYTCQRGYKFDRSNNFTFCLQGAWLPEPPVCSKVCPPLISTSVDLECTHHGKPVQCDKDQLPGTRATLKCKAAYRFPAGVIPDYDAVNCKDDGTWDWPLFKCIPECGVAIGKGQTLIVHGSDAAIGDFPWHAGVYDAEQKDGITQVCGATLVLPNLLVSAAHCFYDDKRGRPFPASKYKIAVGKYYRDWEAQENGEVQKSDVVNITLARRYRGQSLTYANDIALIELAVHVSISQVVMPICVDWLGNTLPALRRGDTGTVVGWGRTQNQRPSSTLQSAKLPYVSFDECLKAVPETFRNYITSDKFCAGHINSTTVAKGDSGGGLAFKNDSTWYLRGIVSVGVPNTLTYSAFTDINQHRAWMSEVRAEVERRDSKISRSRRVP